ncbi:ATP-dependent DNA helicase RecG [Caminicella sporogenes]|uniref:ATP-dependent DNA helicase RecG n=1 Tax=Caminicella sporogenes TaxID=166485 RepID=UPI00253F87B5|nr:ATP-dependent DNA helicase RecG [Caminicella sporogenes]WIF94597.1 ATP-dependent DNA helicase RecG [Caminicella sporogenes]
MFGLDDKIEKIKGIGPKKAAYFSKIGIKNIVDLIYYFPKSYENKRNIKNLSSVSDGEKATIVARICDEPQEFNKNKKLKVLRVLVSDNTKKGYVTFFNSPYLKNIFKKDEVFYFYGKIEIKNNYIQIKHPEFKNIKKCKLEEFATIQPVYGLTKGISQNDIINLQKRILLESNIKLEEYLPSYILNKNRICDINFAIKNIHFPTSIKALKVAKYRLVFEELFFLQLGLFIIKKQYISSNKGVRYDVPHEFYELINNFPFQLTNAQKKVIKDIIKDVSSGKVMNRLVQGDVGSGKTIVALLSMYLAYLNGYQSALMTPTEILAEQHFRTFEKILNPVGVNIGLLTRSVKDKDEVLNKIKSGKLNIIIGTHAIIQDNIEFHNLGLVVTDEQHRFGVRQRSFLKQKGKNINMIVMTATPIPRTLSLILYGDLDISIIDELPPGRKYIKTYSINEKKLPKLYKFIKSQIQEGRQAYIVCPLVEDSENIKAKSAVNLYKELKDNHFKFNNIGLIHGKMDSVKKDEVMQKFKSGKLDILVSTTVIEVGINVPNATVIVIQNAERFGLAQLHQLRGRVGRGKYQSYCFLVTSNTSKNTKERMKIMENTNNGFIIAEKDLELRGPGDFFGTRQHGLPELKIANLFKHADILKIAQNEARNIVDNFNDLNDEERRKFFIKVKKYFKGLLDNFSI